MEKRPEQLGRAGRWGKAGRLSEKLGHLEAIHANHWNSLVLSKDVSEQVLFFFLNVMMMSHVPKRLWLFSGHKENGL